MSDGGKGSKPRPYSVSQDEYDNSWEAIFGKKDKQIMEVINESSRSNTNNSQPLSR